MWDKKFFYPSMEQIFYLVDTFILLQETTVKTVEKINYNERTGDSLPPNFQMERGLELIFHTPPDFFSILIRIGGGNLLKTNALSEWSFVALRQFLP